MIKYINLTIYYNHEYYIQNKISYKNINDEINILYEKNFENVKNINETQSKNFKFNSLIDLIRKKLIEEELNSNKDILLQEVVMISMP